MLRPFRFLWKQFNGPQVTALMTAIFRWFCAWNNTIDYLRHFSVHTSNDAHLTLIGACFGIIRPIVVIPSSKFFLFTRELEHPSDHGLSDLSNLAVGGQLTDLEEDLREKQATRCPAEYYRRILISYLDNTGDKYSLAFILGTVCDIWQALHPEGDLSTSGIGLRYYQEGDEAFGITRTHGDIEVLLGPQRDWGEDDISVIWQGVLQGVFRELLAPETIIDFNFGLWRA